MFDEKNTKTREGSKVVSKDSAFIEFDQSNSPDAILGSTQKVGSISVNETRKGVYTPSVQSAIDDIVNSMILPIGGVLITEINADPAGSPMIERLTIRKITDNIPEYIYIYGYPIKLTNVSGVDQSTITTDIYEKLISLKDENSLIKTVTRISGVDNMLEVTFLDYKPHPITSSTFDGIAIVGEISSVARSGFGTWVYIGENTTLISGKTFYVWGRTS